MAAETSAASQAPGAARDRRMLTACNDGGMRTVSETGDGLRLVTDEPPGRGGTGTAPTPLETVVGALCGCSGVTFAKAAGELGFAYQGIDFGASFSLAVRDLAGYAQGMLYFRTVRVEARVRTAEPAARLEQVAEITERRCPVRNLLSDAGVALHMSWTIAPA
jgi:uncharacterized OsmC-like protein